MSGPLLTPAPIQPEKNWFARHLLVSILLLLGLLALAFVAAVGFGVFSLMKSSDAYKLALAKAQNSPAVVEALGTPIKSAWYVTGNINVSGSSGNADLAIPISGPKGRGTVFAVEVKQSGEWHFKSLEVAIEGRSERIPLLPAGPGDEPRLKEQ